MDLEFKIGDLVKVIYVENDDPVCKEYVNCIGVITAMYNRIEYPCRVEFADTRSEQFYTDELMIVSSTST